MLGLQTEESLRKKITATIHETRTSNKPTDQLSQSCRWNVETKFDAIIWREIIFQEFQLM